MSLKKPAYDFLNELMQKWQQLQLVPNVFAYKLEVTQSKYLPGKYKFYSEFNPKRSALRRPPQTILSLDPQFDEEKFNFKKVAAAEILMKLKFEEDTEISFIINNSPVTKYNTLICPNVRRGLPQRITLDALRFCVDFLLSLEGNRQFRIGYNSPGALASVNHLHLHLMCIEKELYIDHAKLQHLSDPDIYRLDPSMPTEAICFMIDTHDSKTKIELKLNELYKFLIWLCDNNIPYNVFMTPVLPEKHAVQQKLKVFVYARAQHCIVKQLNNINLGFCELSGFVPVGANDLYNNLTELDIITKITNETGQVFNKIYKYFKHNKLS
ncbi:GDP-D-glucose phosphorylase 1 [Calliphora vicina]|uniref:GDP-D-glucose phosphorylase 1 n=1 Tax=Calliphora vicina TaxID=7373 RepID=UPI00325C0FD6